MAGYTRRQFVTAAYAEIGLADYVFDLEPEQLERAGARLDAMMAQWNAKGIRLPYPGTGNPDANDLDAETGVPMGANEAVITNLAMRLAAGLGRQVQPTTMAVAKSSYNALLQRAAMPQEKQYPSTLPAGAGNKWWLFDDPFLDQPVDPLLAGPDGPIDFQ